MKVGDEAVGGEEWAVTGEEHGKGAADGRASSEVGVMAADGAPRPGGAQRQGRSGAARHRGAGTSPGSSGSAGQHRRRRAAQGELTFPTWGGKRDGAGRKRVERPGEPPRAWVRKRPKLSPRTPVHVTVRVTKEVGRLRRQKAYQAIRRALVRVLIRGWMRVVHLSIQRNHVHLVVEAGDERLLARGMQGFEISAAKQLNAMIGDELGRRRPRKGGVFVGRYHAVPLTSPRQVRNALAYVLNNWRRHREDLGGVAQRRAVVDPYSSGVYFDGWKEREVPFAWPRGYLPLPIARPTVWLLTEGWRRHGRVGLRERPGPDEGGFDAARAAARGGARRAAAASFEVRWGRAGARTGNETMVRGEEAALWI